MPRPTRVHVLGGLYYVTCRSLEETVLFRDDKDYHTYLKVLTTYQKQFQFKLFAFALMPKSLSLGLELTNQTTLSTIMHAVNTCYTKYMIKRYGRSGHLFQERFQATLIEKSPYLLRMTAYIHTLPRRHDVTSGRGESPWTSERYYDSLDALNGGPCSHEAVQEVLQQLSCEYQGTSYTQYVSSMSQPALEQLDQELTKCVVGSAAFIEMVERQRAALSKRTTETASIATTRQPEPVRPRRVLSPVLTASVSLTVAALCAAGLYAKNVASLRHTMQVLAQERAMPMSLSIGVGESAPAVALANFIRPSNLNGTSWEVQLIPVHASGNGQIQRDHLRFEGTQVTSTWLSAQGFSGTNYSLRMKDDGFLTWETMQTGPRGEIVLWRGEWDGQSMTGLMTRNGMREGSQEFRFRAILHQDGRTAGQHEA